MSEGKDGGGDGDGDSDGGNCIEVYLRIRPSPRPSNYFATDDVDQNALIFNVPKVEENTYVNNSRTRYGFKFDGILEERCAQEDVFRTVGAPAVRNALEGFNSTVFAYGQTGSGKTFTITGGPERYADRGIIPRAISMLFGEFQRRQDESFSCYVSYLELYNESGYDLLARDNTSPSTAEPSVRQDKVTMMEDEDGNYHFKNLSVHPVPSEEEALNLLFLGDTNRAIGETEMNQSSSRSHCIFTVLVERRRVGTDTVVRSKLNLVDLAGSERVHKTSSSGQTLREAQYINTSLFFLEMVIVALHERSKRGGGGGGGGGGEKTTHVPYRNSMMTSVLRDSLGGNCRTLMVATISPEADQTDESISTCQFAQRVALVRNTAQINEEVEPDVVIRRLRDEVGRLREEVRFLKGENGEGDSLTDAQEEDLARIVAAYVADRDERAELDIGTMTLTKIRTAYGIFKGLVMDARGEGGNARDDDDDDNNIRRRRGGRSSVEDEEIASLKRMLQKRDDEIDLLVDMVKKQGGNPNDVAGALSRRTTPSHNKNHDDSDKISDEQEGFVRTKVKISLVCGVERCSDQSILDEPSLAFDWFRERYPGLAAIEDNKNALKQRYKEAKEMGETVQKSRSSINYHKDTIEQLRRDRAMERVASDVESQEEETKEPHPDEMVHRKAIEQQKKAYKDGFHRLRELRSQIEHIQRLVEKNRLAMQSDFDRWYGEMCGQQATSGETGEGKGEERERPALVKKQQLLSAERSLHTGNKTGSGDSCPGTQNLPPGIKLTGNKEVDDDIIAFYKAKEELLARSKQ